MCRRRARYVIPFLDTDKNLPTVLLVSMIIRFVLVPVSISEVRTICRAAINPIKLVVMSFPLHPDPESVNSALVHHVVDELAFLL